jgi:hypothetical protein
VVAYCDFLGAVLGLVGILQAHARSIKLTGNKILLECKDKLSSAVLYVCVYYIYTYTSIYIYVNI